MKKRLAIVLISALILPLLISCNVGAFQKESNITRNDLQSGHVCVVTDTQHPILLKPEITVIQNILKPYSISIEHIDLAGVEYADVQDIVDITAYTGLIVCLPYDFSIDVFLSDAMEQGISVLQFGGDYYSNDISVSINNEHVGYLMGKSMGETFVDKGNISPKIGFYSSEQKWKQTERGFIEGLSETIPEAMIISRRIVSTNGETVYVSGEENDALLNGVCAFFCSTSSKHIAYSDNIIQAKASVGAQDVKTENLLISLVIEDNGISTEALTQFAQILQGNRTTRTDFVYNAVFEFAF